MPVRWIIDEPRRVVFLRCTGTLTEQELVESSRALLGNPAVNGFNRLLNLSDVTEFRIASDGIRRLADLGKVLPITKRAIVAPTAISFGLARMFTQNMLLSEQTTAVFSDVPSALEFIG